MKDLVGSGEEGGDKNSTHMHMHTHTCKEITKHKLTPNDMYILHVFLSVVLASMLYTCISMHIACKYVYAVTNG